jgi:hypothetical protein
MGNTMTRQQIRDEIDNVPDEYLPVLHRIVLALEDTGEDRSSLAGLDLDAAREADALEWSEGLLEDLLDETR